MMWDIKGNLFKSGSEHCSCSPKVSLLDKGNTMFLSLKYGSRLQLISCRSAMTKTSVSLPIELYFHLFLLYLILHSNIYPMVVLYSSLVAY